jgi:Lon protease-like protein
VPEVLNGRAIPVFPLPSIVLFPRIVLPLHIFESRYRDMLAEVLDSHGRIAMALLKPGWEPFYDGFPDVHPVVGVGKLATYRTRDDGTSDVVLVGECRARVVEWAPVDRGFRRAKLAVLADAPWGSTGRRDELKSEMVDLLRELTRKFEQNQDLRELQKIFAREKDVGFLVDFVAFHFLKSAVQKQRLLEELTVEQRAVTLLGALRRRGRVQP